MSIRGANQDYIKSSNKKLLLSFIQSNKAISRIQLSRITGLTKATITNLINELIRDGFIFEGESVSIESGRHPVSLKIAPDRYRIIGCYIARDFFELVVSNFAGEILHKQKVFYPVTSLSHQPFLENLAFHIEKALTVCDSEVLGIGITTIGPLDRQKGVMLSPVEFHSWHDIHILEYLREKFNLPCFLENDCNASALAEKILGRFRDSNNFVYIGIENGVGAGAIIDGKLYTGSNGYAVEFGHITVDINGEPCPCGNFGCLEPLVKLPRIVKQVKSALELGAAGNLPLPVTWESIVDAAKAGDSLCMKAIDQLIPLLSVAIVNAINIFDPSQVILGHDIVLAADLFIDPLRKNVNERMFSKKQVAIPVEISTFKNEAPIMGSISLVLENFYSL